MKKRKKSVHAVGKSYAGTVLIILYVGTAAVTSRVRAASVARVAGRPGPARYTWRAGGDIARYAAGCSACLGITLCPKESPKNHINSCFQRIALSFQGTSVSFHGNMRLHLLTQ